MDGPRRSILRSDEAELPLLVPVGRRARDSRRLRPPRWFGRELTRARTGTSNRECRPPLAIWAVIGRAGLILGTGRWWSAARRASAPSARCTTTTYFPAGAFGGQRLQHRRQHQQRVGRTGLADTGRQVVDQGGLGHPELLGHHRHGPTMHAGHHNPVHLVGGRCRPTSAPGRMSRRPRRRSGSRRSAPPRASTAGRPALASAR